MNNPSIRRLTIATLNKSAKEYSDMHESLKDRADSCPAICHQAGKMIVESPNVIDFCDLMIQSAAGRIIRDGLIEAFSGIIAETMKAGICISELALQQEKGVEDGLDGMEIDVSLTQLEMLLQGDHKASPALASLRSALIQKGVIR